jgi:cytidyltransferase-like protein
MLYGFPRRITTTDNTQQEKIFLSEANGYFAPKPPKKTDKTRILVFGTFDIIHPAHIQFLLEARKAPECSACELVVVLSRDSSVRELKGHTPIFNEDQRLQLMSALKVIDYVRLGNEGKNKFDVIKEIKPDFIVLGYDQLPDVESLLAFIQKNDLNISIKRLPKYETGDLISSSQVRKKVLLMLKEKTKDNATEKDS